MDGRTVEEPVRPILERRVLREDIRKYLIDAVVGGELKPGQRIVETRIAKHLAVSQDPVREAIRELESMGLVETRPYQGTFVLKLTRERIREAYEVRCLLEAAAARKAVELVRPQQLLELEQLVEEMAAAAQAGDRDLFINKDVAFHEAIFLAAGNRLLHKIWWNVRMGSFTIITTRLSKRSLKDLAERHRSILEGLKKKDAELAARMAKLHIEELMEEVLKEIRE